MLESIIKKIFETVFRNLFEFVLERSAEKIMGLIIEHSKYKQKEILKVAKPILFNTAMMYANLNGRKSATRRIVPERILDKYYDYDEFCRMVAGRDIPYSRLYEKEFFMQYSRYQTGDYLYARETWQYIDFAGENNGYVYKASQNGKDWAENTDNWIWRPSIHMPKEAARFFMQVTDVRVERLHDIGNCKEEGIAPGTHSTAHMNDYDECCIFAALWNSTIPKEKQKEFGWEANPWVFVYEYKRIIPLEAIKNSEGGEK